MNFGWTNPFGSFGGGGGSLSPVKTDLLQWLDGTTDGLTFVDKVDPQLVDSPAVTDVNILVSAGAATLTIPAIVGTETATNEGTASVVVTAQTLTFGVGTVYNVEVDGIGFYPCSEGGILPLDTSGNGNHSTATTLTVGTADGIPTNNGLYGHTPSVVSDGTTGQIIDVGVPMLNTDKVEIIGRINDLNAASYIGAYSAVGRGYIGIGTISFACGWGNILTPFTAYLKDDLLHTFTIEGIDSTTAHFSVDDVTETITGANRTETPNFKLMGIDPVDSYWDVQRYRHWQSGIIVRDMIPLPDGKFLDLVNSLVYSNDGTGTLVTHYSPALTQKTKSVGTFDGVGDFFSTSGFTIAPTGSYRITLPDFRTTDVDACQIFKLQIASTIDAIELYIQDEAGTPTLIFDVEDALGSDELLVDATNYVDGEWHSVHIDVGTAACALYVDGALKGSVSRVPDFSAGAQLHLGENPSGSYQFEGGMNGNCTIGKLHSWDISGVNGKTTSTLTDSIGAIDLDVTTGAGGLDSFWGVRIADPAGTVVDAKNYLPITHLGGYTHNGAECSLIQTDADEAIFGGVTNWGDGVSWVSLTFAELMAIPNGYLGFYKKCEDINGVPHISEIGQYLVSWMPTPPEYLRNLRYWKVCSGSAVALVPAEVEAGTGIGPSEDWADNGEGKILLVEDA